jgi:hypothetical protein
MGHERRLHFYLRVIVGEAPELFSAQRIVAANEVSAVCDQFGAF